MPRVQTDAPVVAAPAHLHVEAPVNEGMVALHDASFVMGSDSGVGNPADGEGPARQVNLSGFRIAATTVTNREFAEFVRATGHVTQAEELGSSFVFKLQVPVAMRNSQRKVPVGLPWWLSVDDACWQRPEGRGSHIRDRQEHPVVHVSWHDARAYAQWRGVRLPTEAQWEYAARGGLARQTFSWGDAAPVNAALRCNIWQGEFPDAPLAPWMPTTAPARSFAPNGFGLYNMAGNVWEWCEDWYCETYHLETATDDPLQARLTGLRSTRGGSFLCHDSYCNRYRVAARGSNTPSSSASNCGFRVVADM